MIRDDLGLPPDLMKKDELPIVPVNPECPEYPKEPEGELAELPEVSSYLLDFKFPDQMFQSIPKKPKKKIIYTVNRDVKDKMEETFAKKYNNDDIETKIVRKVDHKGEVLIPLDFSKQLVTRVKPPYEEKKKNGVPKIEIAAASE